MTDHVKRARSPNYPSISLPDALGQLRRLFDRIQRHKAPKDAVIKGMGYGGWNGASAGALSAHTKFGLLERIDGSFFKISELGMKLLFHTNPDEYSESLHEAARRPTLFSELMEEFPGPLPTEDVLRPWLIRRGFAQSAVKTALDTYRDSITFVQENSNGRRHATSNGSEEFADSSGGSSLQEKTNYLDDTNGVKRHVLDETGPYRVSITRGVIEVNARLADVKSTDELIQVLEAWKILLVKL